eukprot:TRINITY_DN16663_c0_g1_i1.p1 TRINITY_DN16663_c0_g1~~TRINITY_DN16663_c0_g1_i1.p1  ORF type:complete len:151 (+),score=16.78 TRINITY_DN16663_c0_g1_i1:36-455(+)
MDVTSKITRNGYLLKKGKINTSWKCRWCVLTGSKLAYFKNEMINRKPLGFIPLDQAVVRSCVEDVGKDFCFEVVTKDRVYKLSAGSHQEMVDWMVALQPCTQLHAENDLFKEAERNIRAGSQKHFESFEQTTHYPLRYR